MNIENGQMQIAEYQDAIINLDGDPRVEAELKSRLSSQLQARQTGAQALACALKAPEQDWSHDLEHPIHQLHREGEAGA